MNSPSLLNSLNTVCIYCGSSVGNRTGYMDATKELGKWLVGKNIRLIYGGGVVGLMGVLALTMDQLGGKVIGIIPEALIELCQGLIGENIIVRDTHTRKMKMAEMADAFIALPGGFGTLEELLEITTWSQLGIHDKPIGVLNVEHYFDPLLALIRKGVEEGFIATRFSNLIVVSDNVEDLFQKLEEYKSPRGFAQWNCMFSAREIDNSFI